MEYGRWMIVHMNLELYGWAACRWWGSSSKSTARTANDRAMVQACVLGMVHGAGRGRFSWLSGHSGGKLFLDWSGYARVLFPAALGALAASGVRADEQSLDEKK